MSDTELKEQMERETLGNWRSPAYKNLEEKETNFKLIIPIGCAILGFIIGALLG